MTKNLGDFKDIAPFLPSEEEIKELEALMKDLKVFQLITKELQGDEVNLFLAKQFCKKLVEDYGDKYPSLNKYLGTNASIVETSLNRDFENGIVKVIEGREATLTVGETVALERFKKSDEDLDSEASEASTKKQKKNEDSYVSNIYESLLQQMGDGKSKYINLTWIPATSCLVERLFSVCKHVLTDHRSSLNAHTFEAIMLLTENGNEWNMNTVQKALIEDDVDDSLEIEVMEEEGNDNDKAVDDLSVDEEI